jgi:hypothetical protein
LGFGLVWFVVFSNNRWILENQSHFRYFFPCFFVGLTSLTYCLFCRVSCLAPRFQYLIIMIAMVFVSWQLTRSPVGLERYLIFEEAQPYLEKIRESKEGQRAVKAKDPLLIAGNYWLVWPLIFDASSEPLQALSGSATRSKLAMYSLASRAIGNRSAVILAMQSQLNQHKYVEIFCVDASVTVCQNDIENLMQTSGRVMLIRSIAQDLLWLTWQPL